MAVSRELFESACQAYLRHFASVAGKQDELGSHLYSLGWEWKISSHPFMGPVGYLHRVLTLMGPSVRATGKVCEADEELGSFDNLVDEGQHEDPATGAAPIGPELPTVALHVDQSICYSKTWRVPVFYFRVYEDGVPLTVEQALASPAMIAPVEQLHEVQQGVDRAAFPQIAQEDHPATGLASLYLHPCETATRLQEILQDERVIDAVMHAESRYIAAFMTLLSNTVQMRSGDRG